MTSPFEKKRYEKSIFIQFLSFSPLMTQIIHDSIKSCDPPEPDIVCQTKSKSWLYFELVEIIDPGMAKSISDAINFPKACKNALSKLSQAKQTHFNLMYSNALIYFRFRQISTKSIVKLLPQLIEYLITIDEYYEGILSPAEFNSVLSEIMIKRYNFKIQSFKRNSAGSYADVALAQIQSKFNKNYKCKSSVSLLFYYDIQEAFSYSVEESKIIIENIDRFVKEHLSSSCFFKVWGFDIRNQKIVYEYPISIGQEHSSAYKSYSKY